ncbi:MAG TPA: ABC transporter permease [Candidatus Dormibacteraeota bacterium]|nr:ABC transporter permease [Candidatus Dormibacteraeota bacterium]
MTTDPPATASASAPSRARRVARWLHARPRTQLRLLLALPLLWLVVVYLGSLAILLLNAFWTSDPFTGRVNPFDWSLGAFVQIIGNDVYRTIAIRTIGMAALVTVTDALLAFPIAYYMARVASPRVRRLLVVAVLMPLWASYLVKIFAWRTILQGNGVLSWVLSPFGIDGPGTDELMNSWLVFTYLWLPYMILPIYAGLERVPTSLLEASADLGGRAGTTFRRVVLPLVFPALVAGSIFTFSLTLGDYIVPDLVSDAKFIGNVIFDNSALGEFPVAAAYSMLPILIVVLYLVLARRLGAFESL